MTHRSYVNEHDTTDLRDNERLEFLGDAIVGFITGDMLFRRFPDLNEGQLTRLRAALVRTEALAELAVQADLGACLWIGKGEEASGGRARPTNLCAAFEAFAGALYLDQGLEAVQAFLLPRLELLLRSVLEQSFDKDARSRLQEWSQAERGSTPDYQTIQESGPDHAKEFTVEVSVDDEVIGRGVGHSKQAAAQAAAQAALGVLEGSDIPT